MGLGIVGWKIKKMGLGITGVKVISKYMFHIFPWEISEVISKHKGRNMFHIQFDVKQISIPPIKENL